MNSANMEHYSEIWNEESSQEPKETIGTFRVVFVFIGLTLLLNRINYLITPQFIYNSPLLHTIFVCGFL